MTPVLDNSKKTVWIYVDTRRQVGDKDHLKVFADQDGSASTIRKA
jgi:hypothetical protein